MLVTYMSHKHNSCLEINCDFFPPPFKELDAEERALTDGRIGPGSVGIDRASLCGSMTIKDGMEVWQTFICKYVLLKSPVVNITRIL